MFLIWGTRTTQRAIGQIAYACAGCQRQTVYTALVVETRLTIFFIPTFRLRRRYEIVCNVCGRRLRAVDNLARQLADLECCVA